MKNEKEIKAIALQIVELEKKCQASEKNTEYIKIIEDIMANLSLEDMLYIDNYIQENKLLKN